MTLDRMKLSAQTVRDNIAILEEVKEPDDAGYYLQLEHEKFVLECIEKQIPKKVKIQVFDEFDETTKTPYKMKFQNCSICGGVIGLKSHKFCPNCGQALDWSDTE